MKLIDADIFTSELDFAEADVCEELPDSYCEFGFSRENIRKLLRDAPTVDAVPVVRCRECKYHNKPPCPMRLSFNWTEDDDFCSYGERKEGADNEP